MKYCSIWKPKLTLFSESNNINEMAKLTALKIIAKPFKIQKDSEMEENTLAGVLIEMQMQQLKEKKKDIHKIYHKLTSTGKGNNFIRPNAIKMDDKKKVEAKLPKDIIEEKDKKEDSEATKLDPNNCEHILPGQEIKAIEREFWSRIEVKASYFFGGTLGKTKGGITAITVSNNSRLVGVALSTGFILVYDMIYQK